MTDRPGVTLETIAAIWQLAEHVAGTDDEDLPESAAAATRMFLLDTLGVGVAGSAGPWTRRLIETQHLSCPGDQARAWSHGARLSVAGAAVCNAYQTHNGEFDCVHEDAVVHTFTVPVAAALAWAEREGGVGGRDFLTSLALGVDVACSLGVASKSPFRFEALPDVTTLVDDLVPAPSTHPPPA